MSRRPRLLVLNPTCLEVIDAHRDYLDSIGVEWKADPAFRSLRPERVGEVLTGTEALILPAPLPDFPSADQMRRHAELRVLSIAASGYDGLDLEAATANGIVVTHAPVREGIEVVADMTWALLLAVARQVPYYHGRICTGDHSRGMGTSAWGKTLGLIGLGRIGRAVARRAAGFEMRILATDPKPDRAFVEKHGIELVDLPTLLVQSDFVSLHVRLVNPTSIPDEVPPASHQCPYSTPHAPREAQSPVPPASDRPNSVPPASRQRSPSTPHAPREAQSPASITAPTRGMIGPNQLALMKPTAILVNTARRELVDEAALAEAILSGRLAGAGLDDPPTAAAGRILGLPNVVFAPHHGNRAIEGVHAVFRAAIDNAAAVLGGRKPNFVVNPEVYLGGLRAPLSNGSQPS